MIENILCFISENHRQLLIFGIGILAQIGLGKYYGYKTKKINKKFWNMEHSSHNQIIALVREKRLLTCNYPFCNNPKVLSNRCMEHIEPNLHDIEKLEDLLIDWKKTLLKNNLIGE